MATQKAVQVTYQCAGCGTQRQAEFQAGQQQAQAPICCGQPMAEIARR